MYLVNSYASSYSKNFKNLYRVFGISKLKILPGHHSLSVIECVVALKMADRPTPHSIAVCALIALHSDPSSPLHDMEFNPHEQNGLITFLEESVFGNRSSTNAGLTPWLRQVRRRVSEEVSELVIDTLTMACESVDALVDLMESLRVAIKEGLIDALSAHGVFLRQTCLGFEELSFESVTLLWQDLKDRISQVDLLEEESKEEDTAKATWPLSTDQMERLLRQDCLNLEDGTASAEKSFESIELEIRKILEKEPELPVAYFLRYLNCLRHGERVGALDALHQYFDHAMVQHTSPKDILQFSAILLAITHSSFGDQGLALMATEEAVRVAQQSKDAACVAFALGWLFENNGHGTAERRELLKRCVTRASQGRLRPLIAGGNLALAKHHVEEDRRTPAAAWASLMKVTAEQAADNLPNLDRPTYLSQLPKESMEGMARQRLVSAGIWDAFGLPALSGLSSVVALNCPEDLSSQDISMAIQNLSRLAMYGSPSSVLSTAKFDLRPVTNANDCIYARAIAMSMQLRERFGLSGGSFDDQCLHDIALVLHEWAVNRGELDDARALGVVLESYLHPGLDNYDQFMVDIYMQKCLLLSREGRWEKAREVATRLVKQCETKGLKNSHARILVQMAIIQLESNPKEFMSALPPLLEALSICERCEMHGLHAASLSILARVFLRLHNPKRSLAILKAIIPTLLQREHIWFQAEAFLTQAKCNLQLVCSGKPTTSKRVMQAALTALEKCEVLFTRCQDFYRLREVSYLQARVSSQLGKVSERESASKRFTDICGHLGCRKIAPTTILDALNDPFELYKLVQRTV